MTSCLPLILVPQYLAWTSTTSLPFPGCQQICPWTDGSSEATSRACSPRMPSLLTSCIAQNTVWKLGHGLHPQIPRTLESCSEHYGPHGQPPTRPRELKRPLKLHFHMRTGVGWNFLRWRKSSRSALINTVANSLWLLSVVSAMRNTFFF